MLRAAADPRLMKDKMMVKNSVTTIALTGISYTTLDSHGLKGKAWYLENAYNSREAVARFVKHDDVVMNSTMAAIAVVAGIDPVAL